MKTCTECHRKTQARGYCGWHYQRARNLGIIDKLPTEPRRCQVPDCDRAYKCNGLCHFHDNRKRKGMPDWDTRPPRNLVQPPGTRKLSGNGYMTIKQDGGYWELEHRAVMAKTLGRALLPGENVHHINGDRLDNRAANLELWSDRQPKGQRVEDKVQWALDVLGVYAPHLLHEGASVGDGVSDAIPHGPSLV